MRCTPRPAPPVERPEPIPREPAQERPAEPAPQAASEPVEAASQELAAFAVDAPSPDGHEPQRCGAGPLPPTAERVEITVTVAESSSPEPTPQAPVVDTPDVAEPPEELPQVPEAKEVPWRLCIAVWGRPRSLRSTAWR